MLFLTVTGAGQRPVNLLWPVVIIVNGQCLLALPMEHTGSHLRAGLDFACLGWLDPCLQHPWVSSTDRSGRLLRACGGTNVVRDAAAAREPAQRQLDWTYTLSLSLAAFVDLQEHSCRCAPHHQQFGESNTRADDDGVSGVIFFMMKALSWRFFCCFDILLECDLSTSL